MNPGRLLVTDYQADFLLVSGIVNREPLAITVQEQHALNHHYMNYCCIIYYYYGCYCYYYFY